MTELNPSHKQTYEAIDRIQSLGNHGNCRMVLVIRTPALKTHHYFPLYLPCFSSLPFLTFSIQHSLLF